jgi:hypothetical protein
MLFTSLESHRSSGARLGPRRTGPHDVLIMQQSPTDNADASGFQLDRSSIWPDPARRALTRPFSHPVRRPAGGALDTAIANTTRAAHATSIGRLPVAHAIRIAAQTVALLRLSSR